MKRFASLVALVTLFGSQAYAAVPTDVTTALTDMKSDGLAAGALVLVAVIALAALKFIRRAI